ncbi:MAG: TraR/DksA C4-type zinc finger protein [Acidobacteria bacterium]|nr:TraR/DksA C4-type zinc finger protein [Acidobacteriota bacterium]
MANTKTKTKSSETRHFRQVLEQKSSELREQLGIPSAKLVLHATADPYDSADWAEKSHEEWIFLQKNNFEVALLREIEGALERLRDGTYGTCMDCGMPMSRKRLEALPWALLCVTCEERRQSGSN